MPWGRMDDKLWRDRVVRELRKTRLGREAFGSWSYWWSWCLDDPALDGVIAKTELPKWEKRLADHLVSVGFWSDLGSAYRMENFARYSPSASEVEHKREADRTRIAQERAGTRRPSEQLVARDSHATRERVASTRDPSPIPNQIQIQIPPPDLFPRATSQAADHALDPHLETAEGWVGLISPQEPAEAPESSEPPDVPTRAPTGQERAALAAWGGNGASLLELDRLEVVETLHGIGAGLPDNENELFPVRVIRPLDDDDPRDFAQRVRNRFQKLFEDRFNDSPYMGGQAGISFPERLDKTARARGLDPLVLLESTFAVFARSPLDEKAQSSPYAMFASRFSKYLNQPAAKALTGKDALRRDIAEALAKGDQAAYSELDARYREKYLGGRDARPAI